jgi:hypothetical protein
MKSHFVLISLVLSCLCGTAQERIAPVFAATDSLNVYGPWQTKQYKSGNDDLTISYRCRVRKKFMMTCLYTMEVRNDGPQKLKVYFLAGNSGTNYYSGQIGVVREKVKLEPKQTIEVDYRLPIPNNNKGDNDEAVCKKCKTNDHAFTFAE